MIEVFDEKLVDECLSEVADSDIKTYAYCLLDWAVRKRKVQAVPLDRIKQTREDIENIGLGSYLELMKEIECNDREVRMSKKFATVILDKLIAESEEK